MIDFEKLTNLIADKKCLPSDWNEKYDPFVGIYLSDLIDIINQCDSTKWISVDEEKPCADEILAKLSEDFCCGNGRVEILHYCKQYGLIHPEGYYDICGENVPTNAITYWMSIPEIKGEKE